MTFRIAVKPSAPRVSTEGWRDLCGLVKSEALKELVERVYLKQPGAELECTVPEGKTEAQARSAVMAELEKNGWVVR
jgi:hypothetical protein